jgi:methanogenic corrinoid protein MtbC1
MNSFPNALKTVFSGIAGASVPFPVNLARSWPILRLASASPLARPTEELAKIVECEIIPRLMLAHQPASTSDGAGSDHQASSEGVPENIHDNAVSPEAVQAFARMVLIRAPEALMAFIEGLINGGVAVSAIYAELLRPAACLLSDLWDQDLVSYTEVTIGLGRLQQLVRGLDWQTAYNGENDSSPRSVLFAPRPGEQQTFGFYIMEELFRWSGWRAWIETCSTNAQMVSNVQFRWFDMFCMSVCRETEIDEVSKTITAIRRASRNQGLFVMVYGRPFIDHPDLISAVGADGAAGSAGEALDMAGEAVATHGV